MICGITGANGVLGRRFISSYKNIKFIKFKGNILAKKKMEEWIKKNDFDFFLHFAAIVRTDKVEKNYKKAKKINYYATKNIIKLIFKYKDKKPWFFFPSTSHVYKFSKKKVDENSKLKPISKYGNTKLLAEKHILKILKKKIPICIGRIFSFTDRNQKPPFLVPNIYHKLKSKKKSLIFKNLNHERDFISTNDICKIIYFLKNKNFTGVINIGSGKKTNLKNIVKKLNKQKKQITYLDNQDKTSLIANNKKLYKIGYKKKIKKVTF